MNIALINDQPLYSGVGKYTHYIYHLIKDIFAIDLLNLNFEEHALKNQKEESVVSIKGLPIVDNKPLFWFQMRKKIPQYDLYHFTNQNLSFMITKQMSIVTCHDLAPLVVPDNSMEKLWRRYLYNGLKRAKIIMADSFSTKNDLIRIYGIDKDKIVVIYLGVEHRIFHPFGNKFELRKNLQLPIEKKIIINVGTEKRRKNIEGLIRAFALLANDDNNVILLRVGTKTHKIARLVSKLKLNDKVIYYKSVLENELPKLYCASDILVMPSFYEGFGLPALEAMNCGVPVVVSNTSSLPEIVGGAGIKVNPYSIYEIYKVMKLLLNEKNLYNELQEKGITQAKKFTWQKTANEVANIYKSF